MAKAEISGSVPEQADKPFGMAWFLGAIPITLFVFFVGQLIGGVIAGVLAALMGYGASDLASFFESSGVGQFVFVLSAEAMTLLLLFGFMRTLRVTPKRIGLKRAKAKDILYALAGFGIYFITYLAATALAKKLVPSLDLDQRQQLGFDTTETGLALVPIFISLVVLPPLAEEILMRGFLYTGLRTKLKPIVATLITSLLFAAAHLQWGSDAPLLWIAAIDTFVLSLVLCYLRETTHKLWPSILLHALKNGIAFMALFIFKIS